VDQVSARQYGGCLGPSNFDLYVKHSLKLNLFNYPFVKKGNLVAFYHLSLGYFARDRGGCGVVRNGLGPHLRGHLKASSGFGFGLDIGTGARLELVYNLWHLHTSEDALAKVQLRLSLND